MDRRHFFRLGIRNLKDTARRQSPGILTGSIPKSMLDVSVLVADAVKADALVNELLREYFGERMLRLRESLLPGDFPGGILLFQNNELVDYHDGVSFLYAALRNIELELGLAAVQSNPRLLRYVNTTPPMTRSVSIYHRNIMIASVPLLEDRSYLFTGSIGPVRVGVCDGHFRFERSLCRHQTCIAHPPIIAPGQRITCVPSEMTAYIGIEAG